MEVLLAAVLFGLAMAGMGIGVILGDRKLRGSCGGEEVLGPDGNPLSCGACPRKEAEICPTDDPLVALARIGHPNPRDR